MIMMFFDGLKLRVQSSLIGMGLRKPATLRELIEKAVQLDNHLFEHEQTLRAPGWGSNNQQQSGNGQRPPPPDPYGTQPMEIDAAFVGPVKQLSPQQRTYRMTNNLCLYCSKPGHKRAECPDLSSR